jgi:hypothetical protein
MPLRLTVQSPRPMPGNFNWPAKLRSPRTSLWARNCRLPCLSCHMTAKVAISVHSDKTSELSTARHHLPKFLALRTATGKSKMCMCQRWASKGLFTLASPSSRQNLLHLIVLYVISAAQGTLGQKLLVLQYSSCDRNVPQYELHRMSSKLFYLLLKR